ncbi:MAG: hypothetical protein OXJ55_01385 [Caldilineaceae bacterium]|nr:hypothetical protein [Caldilineaceae bacterium]
MNGGRLAMGGLGDDVMGAAEAGEARTHSWVVRHDGLIFGSSWYEEA